MDLSKTSLLEVEEMADSADSASVANRVLTELQSIQQSQRRMEALLFRMLDEGSVSPPPDATKTSGPHARGSSTLKGAFAQRRMKKSTDSGVHLTESGTETHRDLHSIRDVTSLEMQSCPENQDMPEYPGNFHSMLSRGWSQSGNSLARSSRSDLAPDAFIAATLPLSWPTVLVARSKYENERNSTMHTRIKNTVKACSRIWTNSSESTPLQAREWRQWRCTISPGSAHHMALCCLSFCVLIYDFVTIPIILAWDLQMTGFLGVTAVLSVVFWTADMVLNFLTAFYVKGELVFHPAAIAKRYFRTWFLFDFLSVSGDWTSIVLQSVASNNDNSKGMRLMRLVKIARLLRIIGVLRMLRFLNVIHKYVEKQSSDYHRIAMKTVSLLLFILLLTHTMCCAWYAVGKLGPSDTGIRWTDMFDSASPVEYERIYEYVTAFHWAAAQMTLGATDVNSGNSMERSTNIACMLIGLIFSCTLVSSLSATLVDFSITHKDQKENMDAMKRYLKENDISATTSLLVEDQIWERMREEKKGLMQDAESCLQKLLSQQLFARLRYEVCLPTINTHPLLCLWGSVHKPTIQRLAVEAFEFRVLQVDDDLFVAGGKANAAYYIIQGRLEYTQRPDSSPELSEVTTTVSHGAWLCEAALWSEWIHVGTAVAKQRSTLALLKAEELLKVCSEHAVVKTIVTSYSESFHSKIVHAVPPEESWPSDLEVPNTSLAQIVLSMPKEAQVAIGWNVLRRCSGQLLGLSGWASKAFQFSLSRRLEKLEEEVTCGHSILIQVGQEVQLVLSMACVRLLDERQRVLVQIGKWQGEAESVDPVCQLPGHKLAEDATATEKLARLLEAELPSLTGNPLEVEHVEKEETQELSRSFLLKTTYFRTIMTARFTGAWEADLVPLLDLDPQRSMGSQPTGSQPLHSFSSPADNTLLEGLVQYSVYHMKDAKGVSALYAWLPEEVFEQLHANASCHDLVTEWIGRLEKNFAVPTELVAQSTYSF